MTIQLGPARLSDDK